MINISELSKDGTCIFIRHGEKDVNCYGLTEEGKQETVKFSNALLSLRKKIVIYSSPERRCVETANIINSIIESEKDICISDILGKPGVQVKDETKYIKLTDVMRCRDIFREWKKGKYDEEMYEPEKIKEKMIIFFKKTFLKEGITVYISQSGTVACTGYSLNLIDYRSCDDDWVGYLDGYVLRLSDGNYNI